MRRQSSIGRRRANAARSLRAGLCTAGGAGAAVELWRLHPAALSPAATPDGAVVLGCAWLAWAVLGYLAVSVAITGSLHLAASTGASVAKLNRLAGFAPRRVRRAVDRTVTVGVAAAILGTAVAGPAAAATHHGGTSRSNGRFATAGSLDWPGLAATAPRPSPHPTPASPDPRTDSSNRPHRPHRPGRTQAPASGEPHAVVVRTGDSLWSIAARSLGGDPSAAATTRAWHELYAANRGVIGADPNLIHPGEGLADPLETTVTTGAAQ